jgi:hypothetical protein
LRRGLNNLHQQIEIGLVIVPQPPVPPHITPRRRARYEENQKLRVDKES